MGITPCVAGPQNSFSSPQLAKVPVTPSSFTPLPKNFGFKPWSRPPPRSSPEVTDWSKRHSAWGCLGHRARRPLGAESRREDRARFPGVHPSPCGDHRSDRLVPETVATVCGRWSQGFRTNIGRPEGVRRGWGLRSQTAGNVWRPCPQAEESLVLLTLTPNT